MSVCDLSESQVARHDAPLPRRGERGRLPWSGLCQHRLLTLRVRARALHFQHTIDQPVRPVAHKQEASPAGGARLAPYSAGVPLPLWPRPSDLVATPPARIARLLQVPSLSWHLHLLPLKQLLLANNLSTVLPPPPVPMGRCRSLPLRLRGCRSPKPHEPTQNAEMPPPTWRETPFRRACFDTGLSSGAAARAASRQEGARRVATCLRARHARQPPVRGQLRANEAQVGHDDRGAGGNACGPGGRVCGRAPNRHH